MQIHLTAQEEEEEEEEMNLAERMCSPTYLMLRPIHRRRHNSPARPATQRETRKWIGAEVGEVSPRAKGPTSIPNFPPNGKSHAASPVHSASGSFSRVTSPLCVLLVDCFHKISCTITAPLSSARLRTITLRVAHSIWNAITTWQIGYTIVQRFLLCA